jgi:hypothetical protein
MNSMDCGAIRTTIEEDNRKNYECERFEEAED